LKAEFDALNTKIVTASIDPLDKAQEVANDVSFPVGYGATREIGDEIGAFWEDRRGLIQPSEFIIGADNKIVTSSYSDGPLARMDAADVIKLIKMYESRK
jgi:peroxiredoxin